MSSTAESTTARSAPPRVPAARFRSGGALRRGHPLRRNLLHRHPEYPALAVCVLVWIVIVAIHLRGGEDTGGPDASATTMTGMDMTGMDMSGPAGGTAATAGGPGWWHLGFSELGFWVLMCVATMIPVAVPAVRHVAANTLRRRRHRAVTGFLVAYLGTWTAFGLVVLPALALLGQALPRWSLVLTASAFAVVWPLLPAQVTFRRRCHLTVPLPPSGWRAHAGCLRFGLRHGLACIGVCGPLMLLMAVLLHAHLLWMVLLSGLVLLSRRSPRRRRASRSRFPAVPLFRSRSVPA